MRVAIIGAPGSGKTTQSQLLASSLKIPAISVGEMLREPISQEGERAQQVREALAVGELVSDEIALDCLNKSLLDPAAKSGFVLDGMPRTFGEAQKLTHLFALDRVFHLDIRLEEALKRLIPRGRGDDLPQIIERRFAVYTREKEAIVGFYRSLGILVQIDASVPSVQVHQEIVGNLR